MTVAQAIADYLESRRVRGYTAATLAGDAHELRRYFERWLAAQGIEDLRAVTRDHVMALMAWMAARGYAPRTRQATFHNVVGLFGWLEAQGKILVTPCLGAPALKVERALPRVILTIEEVRRILIIPDAKTPEGIRNRALLELLYSTGLRLNELVRLTVYDIDLRAGYARVIQGKYRKDRMVPLGGGAVRALRAYIDGVRKGWLGEKTEGFHRPYHCRPSACEGRSAAADNRLRLWLSERKPHQALCRGSLQQIIMRIVRAAGIDKRATAHAWRHTCATHLLSGGANLVAVQQLLGHRSLASTQIYTRVAVSELKAVHRRAHPRCRATGPAA